MKVLSQYESPAWMTTNAVNSENISVVNTEENISACQVSPYLVGIKLCELAGVKLNL